MLAILMLSTVLVKKKYTVITNRNIFRFIKALIAELAAQEKKVKIEDYTYDNADGASGGGGEALPDEEEISVSF